MPAGSVLLTWELGGGYGHVTELAPLASCLASSGYRLTAALQQPKLWNEVAPGSAVNVIAAPNMREKISAGTAVQSWAAILGCSGFGQAERLAAGLLQWLQIFAEQQTTAVVGNHAPLSLLAAYAAQLPYVAAGTGFHSPPAITPLPPIPSSHGLNRQAQINYEQAIVANCNKALAMLPAAGLPQRAPPLDSLAALLRYARSCFLSYAELDHYGSARHSAVYCGSLISSPKGKPPVWPKAARKAAGGTAAQSLKLLVYLNRQAVAKTAVMAALASLNWPAVAHITGLPDVLPDGWLPSCVRLYRQRINVGAALPRCRVVICHSGHGMVSQALLAGKPLLLIPTNAEQTMLASRVVKLGAALMVQTPSEADIHAALHELVKKPSYSASAQRFAAKYGRTKPADLLTELEPLLTRPAIRA